MKLIYVAGPYSVGDTSANVRLAVQSGYRMRFHGVAAIVPHRNHLDELLGYGEDYNTWLAEDLEILSRCDAVVRLPGESPGADAEVAHAESLGIPVFDVNGAREWARKEDSCR